MIKSADVQPGHIIHLQETFLDRRQLVYRVGPDLDPESIFHISHKKLLPYKIFETVEQCLIEILSSKNYSDLPRSINLDYTYFQQEKIPVEEVVNSLRTAVALASKRLGRDYESVKINFRVGAPISQSLSDYLESIGVDNLTPTPSYWGLEIWLKYTSTLIAGCRVWPKFLIEGNELPKISKIKPASFVIELTPRQQEIADLLAHRGLSNKQIAKSLNITESAVKLHVGSILKKYKLRNRTQLSQALSKNTPA